MSEQDSERNLLDNMIDSLALFADRGRQRQWWVIGEPGIVDSYQDEVSDYLMGLDWLRSSPDVRCLMTEEQKAALLDFGSRLEEFASHIAFVRPPDQTHIDKLLSQATRRQAGGGRKHLVRSDEDILALPEWSDICTAAASTLEIFEAGTSHS